jgi:hypothetical protein
MSRRQNRNQRLKKQPTTAVRCRYCDKSLTSPATAKRGECRSCRRVVKAVADHVA